jgi:fibrillarin-like rRNA methylase
MELAMFAVAAVVYVAFLGKTTGVATQKKGLAFGGSRGCGMSHVSDSSRHFMVFCVLVFALQ